MNIVSVTAKRRDTFSAILLALAFCSGPALTPVPFNGGGSALPPVLAAPTGQEKAASAQSTANPLIKAQAGDKNQTAPESNAPAVGHRAKRACLNFERFRHEKDAWKLLNDPQVQHLMRLAMGNDIEHFLDWCYGTNDLALSGNDVFFTAGMIGGGGEKTAFFDLNIATGRLCIGYMTDGVEHVYGASRLSQLPRPVKEFFENDSDHSDVEFKQPNPKPVVTFKPAPAKKNLNTTCLTGTYEREPSRFTTGLAEIQVLPGNRIKFDLFANLGGRTGGISDTLPLIDNHVIKRDSAFQQDQGKYIEIIFRGKDLIIDGTDEAFCGSGVTLLGTYRKIDDAVPKFAK